jgi:hypothetical protein
VGLNGSCNLRTVEGKLLPLRARFRRNVYPLRCNLFKYTLVGELVNDRKLNCQDIDATRT